MRRRSSVSTCDKVVASHELGPLPQSLTANYFIWASLPSIREDTLERTRVRLESSRASTRKSYAVPDIPWGPATKGGGLGLDQLGRPRARRQASTTRGLAASPKGIAPQTREREELTIRRALRTTPLSQERVGGESEEPAQPECWRGRRAWRGHRAGTAPGQEEQRESCRSSTQRARPRGTRNVLGRTSRPECSRRKIREDWQEG